MRLHIAVAVGSVVVSSLISSSTPVHVAIAPNKAAYVAGEPVFINARIYNLSDSPLTIVVPSVDSCESAVGVVVDGLARADLPTCPDLFASTVCAFNGAGAQQIEVQPGSFYEMRRFLNLLYDLQRPGTYRAHVKFKLMYSDHPSIQSSFNTLNDEAEVSLKVASGDADALRAAFATILADLDQGDFQHQWNAQLVLLQMAPRFAEDRILALSGRLDVGVEAMPALRKLGTTASLQRLEDIAFEAPDGNVPREQIRYAALNQIKYVNDRSLLPRLYAVMAQDRWQSIRLAAASAAARIAHGEAVPEISTMMRSGDSSIAIAGAEALGETKSREAVEALISVIPDTWDDNEFHALIEALGRLTHRKTSFDPADRITIHEKWNDWWTLHHTDARIYGPDTCGVSIPLN